jgi:polar amino acid transport system substrate-binding protein
MPTLKSNSSPPAISVMCPRKKSRLHILNQGLLALLVAVSLNVSAVEPGVVRFVALESPPMAMVDANSPAGIKGLYAETLENILGQRMKRQWSGTLLPWKRAQAEVQSGTADIMITIPTLERRTYALVSTQAVYEEYLYVYTYKDHPKIGEIRKIKTANDILRLGLIPATNLGNNWHRENIDAEGIKTHYIPAEENLAKFLAAKRADIMIDTPSSMNRIIDNLRLTQQIEMTPARFGPIKFHILVSKKSPLASSMQSLNQVVEQFVKDGTRERLAAKYVSN